MAQGQNNLVDLNYIMTVLETIATADAHRDLWWRTDGEYAPIRFFINCNDAFIWGSADCEDVTPENVELLQQAYGDYEAHGGLLFCARMRKMRPQGAMYHYLDKKYWGLFDACGPEREVDGGNPYKQGDYKPGR